MLFPFDAGLGLDDDDIRITHLVHRLAVRAKLQTASAGLEMDIVREA